MKTKLFLLFFALTVFVLKCNAQTDSAFYLNKTMEKLKSGDCDVARKFYNVYKEVYNNNKPVSSIEVLLDECSKKDTFAVGETMMVNGKEYIVAYTRDGGRHGLAVMDNGYTCLFFPSTTTRIDGLLVKGENNYYVSRKRIPTYEELNLIYRNRDTIRFYDVYWTCTQDVDRNTYKVIDFATGKTIPKERSSFDAKILLIHRF